MQDESKPISRWKQMKRSVSRIFNPVQQKASQRNTRSSYEYDAFVSYCDSDNDRLWTHYKLVTLEQKYGLKLFIRHRDSMPGGIIADEITTKIQRSNKTLVILSPQYLKDPWRQFELKFTQAYQVDSWLNILIFVILNPISKVGPPFYFILHLSSMVKLNDADIW